MAIRSRVVVVVDYDRERVTLEKHAQVAQDIRTFIEDKNFPKESVYRAGDR